MATASNVSLGGGSRELVSSWSLEPFIYSNLCFLSPHTTGVPSLSCWIRPSVLLFGPTKLFSRSLLGRHFPPTRGLPRTSELEYLGSTQAPTAVPRIFSLRHLCLTPRFASPFLTTYLIHHPFSAAFHSLILSYIPTPSVALPQITNIAPPVQFATPPYPLRPYSSY